MADPERGGARAGPPEGAAGGEPPGWGPRPAAVPRRDSKYEPKAGGAAPGGGGWGGGGGPRAGRWASRAGVWLAGTVALLFVVEIMLSIAVLIGPLASTLRETSAALHLVNVEGMVVNADLEMGSMEIHTDALNMVTAAPATKPEAREPAAAGQAGQGRRGGGARGRDRNQTPGSDGGASGKGGRGGGGEALGLTH